MEPHRGRPTRRRRLVEIADEFFDMVFFGHLVGVARLLHATDWLTRVAMRIYALVVNHRAVVHPSAEGFGRRSYFRHDEIEYGVPRDNLLACLEEVHTLLRQPHGSPPGVRAPAVTRGHALR